MSIVIGENNRPIIAYCDRNDNLRVYICDNADCATGTGASSPILAAGVAASPSPAPSYLAGVQLTIARRPCGRAFPIISYTGMNELLNRHLDVTILQTVYNTSALGVVECGDDLCSTSNNYILYESGISYASLIIPPVGHPYESMPIITFSQQVGSTHTVSTLVCKDGTCGGCAVTSPPPTEPQLTVCESRMFSLAFPTLFLSRSLVVIRSSSIQPLNLPLQLLRQLQRRHPQRPNPQQRNLQHHHQLRM